MPQQFIFAKQVEMILKSGKTEIGIPKGARISAAAADLIRAHKLKINTVDPGVSVETAPESKEKASDTHAEPGQTIEKKEVPESKPKDSAPADSAPAPDGDMSKAMLEEIVNRVVNRFKQLKGIGPVETKRRENGSPALEQPAPADDDDLVICRCEEITKGSIKEAIRNGMQTLNGIKRITRAGMGLCQGQTCQRLVTQILAEELGLSAAEIAPTTARGPVRPIRLAVFANR